MLPNTILLLCCTIVLFLWKIENQSGFSFGIIWLSVEMTRQARTAENSCYLYVRYDNMNCQVFKRGIENWKDFCQKIHK